MTTATEAPAEEQQQEQHKQTNSGGKNKRWGL